MKLYFLAIVFLTTSAVGQINFKGILLCKQDSTPIQYASVRLTNIDKYTQTNSSGEFHFQIPRNLNPIHFQIFGIGLRDSVSLFLLNDDSKKIYVDKFPLSLTPIDIKGLSAKEIVRKAVSLIPVNYTDSSYVSFSFYRQYQNINGEFKNLAEAQTIVSFLLNMSKGVITSNYGFDIEQMRRTNFSNPIDDMKYNDHAFSNLLDQNPVYNLLTSSLNPKAFNYYKFSFDTLNTSDDYMIRYSCDDFSGEDHGVENFKDLDW